MSARSDELITLDVVSGNAGPDHANLALKAAKMFQDRFGGNGYDIILEKEIPPGAGLGGGSADAAATLHLARLLSGLAVPDESLREIGFQLGADIPFCLLGGLARVSGVGEVLAPMEMPQRLFDSLILLAIPNFGMPTSDVYAAWDRSPATGEADVLPVYLAGLTDDFVNDLEPAAEQLVPDLRRLRSSVSQAMGAPARMTGSGSAIFAFAPTMREARRAARRIAGQFAAVLLCRPSSTGVVILA